MLRNAEAIAMRDPALRLLSPCMEQLRDAVGESVPELSSIAATIDAAGEVFAVSVAGPTTRFMPRIEAHAAALVAATGRMQTHLTSEPN